MGATNEGQPQFAASRMGVGPLHIIDEVTEGNEVMEKRERQEGITSGQAKGQTQRWQPLQPNLERVNEAARIDPPQVLSEEPTAVMPRDNQGETAASIRMRMRRGWRAVARA